MTLKQAKEEADFFARQLSQAKEQLARIKQREKEARLLYQRLYQEEACGQLKISDQG